MAVLQAKRCAIQPSRHADRAVCRTTSRPQLTAREGDHEAHCRVVNVDDYRDATVP
jgi:hypothetical protein